MFTYSALLDTLLPLGSDATDRYEATVTFRRIALRKFT